MVIWLYESDLSHIPTAPLAGFPSVGVLPVQKAVKLRSSSSTFFGVM